MCTLSWEKNGNRYCLVFNRDERKSRGKAYLPDIRQDRQGFRFLSPIDSDAGGSWLMANEHGFTACLLNNYTSETEIRPHVRSRGEIPLLFSGTRSVADAERILQNAADSSYQGFDLFLFSDRESPVQFRWNTRALVRLNPGRFATSSSFCPKEVYAHRCELFTRYRPRNLQEMLQLHKSHEAPSRAYAPCMHREDACTVSQCVIVVDQCTLSMRYAGGSPCRTALSAPLELKRSICLT